MKMLVIGLCHGGNPNDIVIGSSNRMIVVSEMSRDSAFSVMTSGMCLLIFSPRVSILATLLLIG
jgi:hypothetical protein